MLPVVPVTDPALPATPGVPCVGAGLPMELGLGCDVGRVPTELGCVVPGCVVWVVVAGCDCVVDVPVCVPIPGLGVTVLVLCAVAMPTARANTDDANKILRIVKLLLVRLECWNFQPLKFIHSQKLCFLSGMPSQRRGDVAAELPDTTISRRFHGRDLNRSLARALKRWTNAVLCFYPSACT
jgi:hypothetical protein